MHSRQILIICLIILLIPDLSHSLAKTGWTQYCGYQATRCAASQGEICWIGNYGDGLYRINTKTSEVTHFTNLNSDLPSNLVSDISIGKDNVTWIATAGGLASFDGTSWKVFNRENAPFVTNSIGALDTDGEGNLWVSTSGGFYCLNNNKWIDILEKYPGFPLDVLSGTTKLICVGSQVWMQFMNYIVCFNNGTWKSLAETNSFCISKDGTLWYISTKDRLLTGLKDTTIQSIPLPAYVLSGSLFVDTSDTKWIFRNDTLFYENEGHWLNSIIPQNFRSETYFSFIEIDDSGSFWLYGKNQFVSYIPSRDEWHSFPVVYTSDFRYYNILKLATDADNDLWVLSNGSGLNYCNSNIWTQSEPFSRAGTREIKSDKQGKIHVASFQSVDTFLILFTAERGGRNADGFWSVSQCTLGSSGSSNLICYNSSANTWIFSINSYSHGFSLATVRDGKKQLIPYPNNDSTKNLVGLDVTEMGTIWALTRDNGLFRYTNNSWEKRTIDNTLVHDTITSILGGGGDTVWIGIGKGDLIRFDGTNWQRVDTKLDDKSFLIPIHYNLTKGELWCKTIRKHQALLPFSSTPQQVSLGDGLYCFDGTTGTHYTTVNSGICDLDITSVAPDKNGLWVASRNGLAYWDRSQTITTLPEKITMSNFNKNSRGTTYITTGNMLNIHLDSPGAVTISIYNISGQLLQKADIGKRNAGVNLIRLSDFNAGNYAQNMVIVNVTVRSEL